MRIPRLRARRTEFRRSRSPPPAARRFLAASLGAGLFLLAALAVVFLPVALRNQANPPIPIVTLEPKAGDSSVLIVTHVTIARPLAEYRAEYYRDSANRSYLMGSIDPLGNRTTSFLEFRDTDSDGNLSPLDEFTIRIDLAYRNRLLVIYTPAARIVGGWPLPP